MGNKKPNEMSFLEHLDALRKHLIRSILFIIIFAFAAFFFKDFVFNDILLAPKMPSFITNRTMCRLSDFLGTKSLCINQKPFSIINIKMTGQFMTHITVSLIIGLVVAFPFVFNEFWKFLKPALKKKEISNSRGAVFFASVLFSLGALFGYYIIVPLSMNFLGNYNVSPEVVNKINLNSYIQTFTSVVLASAVVFELPVLIFFLSKIGLVTPKFLKKYRKHSLVVILALSAIITPPDIFSQILVSLPLWLLYEIGIGISKRVEKRNAKKFLPDVVEK
ncbi:MAG: twin-arginine translocase subunit TatC [Bacteroidales bacterium]|nr:twin-arginine translocase subunit TatC [Bacteroidales bacterium]